MTNDNPEIPQSAPSSDTQTELSKEEKDPTDEIFDKGEDTTTNQVDQLREIDEEINQVNSAISYTSEALATARASLGLGASAETPPSILQDREALSQLEKAKATISAEQTPQSGTQTQQIVQEVNEQEDQSQEAGSEAAKILTSEEQDELINTAMAEFESAVEQQASLRKTDQEFVNQVRNDLSRTALRYLEGSPSQVGAGAVSQLAGEFSAYVKASLNSLEQESAERGINSQDDRQRIKALLVEAAQQPDEKDAYAILEDAMKFFSSSEVITLEARNAIRQMRRNIQNLAQENSSRAVSLANSINARIEEQGRGRGAEEDNVGSAYLADARDFERRYDENYSSLDFADRQALNENEARKNRFHKQIEKLVSSRF